MSTIGFNKLRYEDDVNKLIDKLNRNFQALEFLLANGNLDGVNMKDSYIENLTVKAANIVGSLVVGENVDIGDTLVPVNSAIQEKRRVFIAEPVPPYDVGDLWTTSTDMLVCNTAKDSDGSYSLTDWVMATNYTNPSGVTTIINDTVTTGFLNAVGINASAIAAGELVVGVNVDIGDALDPISSAVQEKKRVFVVQPTPPYDVGDLWTTEEDMLVCNTAKDSEGSYSLTDWAKATNYTNPTNVTTIIGNTVTTGFLNAVGISANAITAGTMNAARISGGTISGVTIDVTTDATIGQWLTLDGTNFMAGIRWMDGATKKAEIYIDPASWGMFISSGSGIYANGYRIDQASTAKFG
jgi:hypothetical protein